MPVAEITIDIALVRAMLAEQHPDLADLPITPLAHGWDNEMFRLGPDLVARLPRRSHSRCGRRCRTLFERPGLGDPVERPNDFHKQN